ncbi:MAG TPA: type III-A CRISPR-associated RAMP protein Csm3 [Cytophagaceae bacterium]
MSTGKFYGKVFIEGQIECLTGLHIGAGKETLEIGGLDMPVIRDPLTREPYIPGSSIKGKMRSLLEKLEFARNSNIRDPRQFFSKSCGEGVNHHECNDEKCPVCRLYGTSKGGSITNNRPARLYVYDAHLSNKDKLEAVDTGLYLTELKYENTLDRITSAASPRQIERVPRGAMFAFAMVYNQDSEKTSEFFKNDLKNVFYNILLLKDDALGGSVSRGYGRIDIKDVRVVYRPIEYYVEGKGERVFKQGEINENEGLKDFFDWVLKELAS